MNAAALMLLGLLTGNELGIAAFVHPALSTLPDRTHAASVQKLARILGRIMPFWYGATLFALLLAAWRAPKATRAKTGLSASAALMSAVLIFTLIGPVPINDRVIGRDLEHLPANWKLERTRWDWLHTIRVGMLLLSLTAAIFGGCGTTKKD